MCVCVFVCARTLILTRFFSYRTDAPRIRIRTDPPYKSHVSFQTRLESYPIDARSIPWTGVRVPHAFPSPPPRHIIKINRFRVAVPADRLRERKKIEHARTLVIQRNEIAS